MSRYSDERRKAVVAKLLPPYNLSVAEVASQENISPATIYKWRKEARTEGRCLPDSSDPRVEGWSSRDKFAAVVETAAMNTEVSRPSLRIPKYSASLNPSGFLM